MNSLAPTTEVHKKNVSINREILDARFIASTDDSAHFQLNHFEVPLEDGQDTLESLNIDDFLEAELFDFDLSMSDFDATGLI